MKLMKDQEPSEMCYKFDLSHVPGMSEFKSATGATAEFKSSNPFINCKSAKTETGLYHLIKYDKIRLRKYLNDAAGAVDCEDGNHVRYVRSVVANEHRELVGFAPPMCVSKNGNVDGADGIDIGCIKFAEEFVEGTMINLFYNSANDVQKWEFSTKNVVSPQRAKGVGGKCFRSMFLEACANANLNFDDLPKEYSYSFVMKHPDNVIVAPVKTTSLYIIAIYLIDNLNVYEMNRSVLKWGSFSKVAHPARFTMKCQDDFDKIVKTYASRDSLYYYPGVMFRTVSGERFKFRNPNYESAKNKRGDYAKNGFVYLHLKKLGYLRNHYERYPEDEFAFSVYQESLYNYTRALHTNYMNCYVYKTMPLKDFPREFRNNLFKLHDEYINILKMRGDRVSMSYVIQFVNQMSVLSQMHMLHLNPTKHPLECPMPALTSLAHTSEQDANANLRTPEYSPPPITQCPNAP